MAHAADEVGGPPIARKTINIYSEDLRIGNSHKNSEWQKAQSASKFCC